jgi:SAM-dependent methyltransferase
VVTRRSVSLFFWCDRLHSCGRSADSRAISPRVAELDRRTARSRFDRAAATYAGASRLEAEVGARMLERLEYVKIAPRRVLDAGCGPAREARALGKRYRGAALIALDISLEMLRAGRAVGPFGRIFRGHAAHALCADFERLLSSTPALSAGVARLMIARRAELESKLEALVFRDVTSKLAELLIKLGDEYGVDDSRGTLVALKITHQELANLIGSTRETVSLTLSQFKRKRLIVTEGRKVILSDLEALRALL